MRVMAQVGMVMNLDKCIGCHTCSVTCKQAWTNRAGVEYVWFNNVETRPGQGYPRTYQDQEQWQGGWVAQARQAASCARAARFSPADQDLHQPEAAGAERLLRAVDLRVRHADLGPAGRAHPGRPAEVADHGQADEDRVVGQLGRRPRPAARSSRPRTRSLVKIRDQVGDRVKMEFEQAFMFYLPRICEHCLNPACVAACPVGRDVQAQPRTASSWSTRTPAAAGACASPAARTRRSTSTTARARPRSARCATRASRSACRPCARRPASGRLRYLGLFLYDADRVTAAAAHRERAGPLRGPARPASSTRTTRRWSAAAQRDGIPADWIDAARTLPGLQAGQGVPGRAAAASGVPHDADGLVHPAAVAGRRRPARHRPRRRGRRQPVRRPRLAADPDRVPRRAVHRRRSRPGARLAGNAGRDALLHARPQPRRRARRRRSPRPSA